RLGRGRIDAGADEAAQYVVEEVAALGGTWIADQRLKRYETQNAPGIDGIRVPTQRFDLRDGKSRRSRLEWRSRAGALGKRQSRPFVESVRPAGQHTTAGAHCLGLLFTRRGD